MEIAESGGHAAGYTGASPGPRGFAVAFSWVGMPPREDPARRHVFALSGRAVGFPAWWWMLRIGTGSARRSPWVASGILRGKPPPTNRERSPSGDWRQGEILISAKPPRFAATTEPLELTAATPPVRFGTAAGL